MFQFILHNNLGVIDSSTFRFNITEP